MNKIYEKIKLLEENGAFMCTGDCRHCPYYHAINYTWRACDIYYVLERNGIELSTEDYEQLDGLVEDCEKLSQRCDELRGRLNSFIGGN